MDPVALTMPFRVERTHLTSELVLWTLQGTPDPATWSSVLAEVTDWLRDLEQRGCKVALVIDTTEVGQLPGSIRTLFGEWRVEQLPLIANTCHCAAYVAANPIMRSVFTALFWLASPVIPVQVCGTRAEALDWVRSRLEARHG